MNSEPHGIPLLPIGTLGAWLFCSAIGVLGLLISYAQISAPAPVEIPPTQLVEAQLAPQPLPQPSAIAPPLPDPQALPTETPPNVPPPPPAAPSAPAMVPVAPASPAISFAVPVEGLTHVVDINAAGFTGPIARVPPVSGKGPAGNANALPGPPKSIAPEPSVIHLSVGQGQGSAIRPEYPREAILAQEEGTVGVRFTVGEDGQVTAVDVTLPSRWPLLNQAATRAVRQAVFPPGPRRIFDVPIEFELNR